MKKYIFILIFALFLLIGCRQNNEEINLVMNCNNTVTELTVKENDSLSCYLLNEEYIFTISVISDDSITITTDGKGISSGPGILDSEQSWVLQKSEKLIIHTNSTDYQENVEFSW